MRIPSGVTDQYIYFVAVDATDLKTRETGLSGFTVYRSRDGAAAAAFTTPTVNETDVTNMPGVYELLLDEDMTIGSGNDSEEMVFHITVSGMAPVTRTIELYRPKITAGNTLSVESDGDATKVNTLDGHTAQTGDNFARLGAPAGASVSADVAAIKAETASIIDDTDLIDDATSGLAKIATDVAAVLVDTGTTLDGKIDTIDTNVDAILVDTGTTLQAELDGIQADTEDIQTRLPAALTIDGNIKADTLRIGGTLQTANDVGADVDAILVDTSTTLQAELDGIQADTEDLQTKVGTPAVDVSADVAAVKVDTAAILVDTGTTLDGKINTIDTNVDSILADTGTDGVVVAAASKTGYALSATGVDGILDETIGDSTVTMRQALKVAVSALAGKLSGAATTTVSIRNVADDADVIVATVDADGNRSAVTLTL